MVERWIKSDGEINTSLCERRQKKRNMNNFLKMKISLQGFCVKLPAYFISLNRESCYEIALCSGKLLPSGCQNILLTLCQLLSKFSITLK